jgi:hypothetical protein
VPGVGCGLPSNDGSQTVRSVTGTPRPARTGEASPVATRRPSSPRSTAKSPTSGANSDPDGHRPRWRLWMCCSSAMRRPLSPYHLDHHGYYGHWHLRFDEQAGRKAFRDEVNLVLARNGLMYKLEKGRIDRLAREPLGSLLRNADFDTGDEALDDHLTSAVRRFRDPDPDVRREALEELWDGWERLKTIQVPTKDKATSAAKLLDVAADGQVELRAVLEAEAKAISAIGNRFHIRHSEVDKAPIVRDEDLDYLFHRPFALIWSCCRPLAALAEPGGSRQGPIARDGPGQWCPCSGTCRHS